VNLFVDFDESENRLLTYTLVRNLLRLAAMTPVSQPACRIM